MRASRVFRVIWRINGVLLLLAGALVVGLVVAGGVAALWSSRQEGSTPVAEVPERGESLFLGQVEEVGGSPYVLLPLHAGEASGRFGAKFSSGSYEGETRNLLFHDVEKGTSRWLLPEQTTVIRHHALLWEDGARARLGAGRDQEEAPVRWIRYELEPARLAGQPEHGSAAIRLAVSGPSGDDLATMLEGIDEVLGYGPLRATRQVVFFRRGREHLAGELDYATRKPIQGRPLLKP